MKSLKPVGLYHLGFESVAGVGKPCEAVWTFEAAWMHDPHAKDLTEVRSIQYSVLLFLVVRPGATSFLLLVAMPFATIIVPR